MPLLVLRRRNHTLFTAIILEFRVMHSYFTHINRVLMENGNGCHCVTPTRAGKEHGGRNMPLNHIENASELVKEKTDRVNLSEVFFFLRHHFIC